MGNEELTEFQKFAKLNDKYIHFSKPTSKYLNGRIAVMATVKLMQEEKGFKLQPETEKQLQEFADSFSQQAQQEIENAEKAIHTWLDNLIKAVYNYKEISCDEVKIIEVRKKVLDFLNDSGLGLNPEVVFLLVTLFCI